ncbi:unnamed protein product, partial [Ixodes pacificus]
TNQTIASANNNIRSERLVSPVRIDALVELVLPPLHVTNNLTRSRSVEQRAGTHGRKDPLKHEGRRDQKKKSVLRAADPEPAARPRPDAATNYRRRLETILSRGTPFS